MAGPDTSHDRKYPRASMTTYTQSVIYADRNHEARKSNSTHNVDIHLQSFKLHHPHLLFLKCKKTSLYPASRVIDTYLLAPMAPAHKPQVVAPSSSSEPSEPSFIKPENKSKEQLTGTQEENPQVIMHKPGKQAADAKRSSSKGSVKEDRVAREGFSGGGYTEKYRSGAKL